MSNLLVIVICLALGLALQRSRQLPESSAKSLNLYVIYLALPALVLSEIPKLDFDRQALLPVIATWSVMVFSAALVWITARWLKWSRPVTGALMLVIPLGNTSFVGIPLIEALLGAEALPYAILYDQFGTVIALNTYGVLIAAWYSGQSAGWRQVAKTILSFPPFIAFCFALLVALIPWQYPSWTAAALGRIAASLTPVVMVAVGLQWQLRLERETLVPVAVGLGYKLLLIPAVVFAVLWYFNFDSLAAKTVVLQAAMPAMISAGILAIGHGLAPRMVSTVIGYGLLFSLVTVYLWSEILPW